MNKEQFEGNWNQLKGKIKEKWGRLSDNDLTVINGQREQLVGHIQKAYGIEKEAAEKEIEEWEKTVETREKVTKF